MAREGERERLSFFRCGADAGAYEGVMPSREVVHQGLRAIEIERAGARLVVVHEVGPRIAWFGPKGGPNLLAWDRDGDRRRGAWTLRGGHRLWLTRVGADETEETYGADDAPCRVRRHPGGVMVVAPPDAQRLERGLAISAGRRGFVIEHHVRNAGDMLWAGGAWALTCTRPRRGVTYGIPWGPPAAWDTVSLVIPRRWGGDHTARVDDPQIVAQEHGLVVRPASVEAKRMVRATPGVIGMTDRAAKVSFVKHAAFDPDARYPLGTNLAVYIAPDGFMVELETMSPQRTLRPGDTLVHRETWALGPPIDWDEPR